MQFAYGRRPAVRTARASAAMFAMAAALDPLGPPPSVCNDYVSAVKVPWQMYFNDTLGSCVPADTAHAITLRTANVSNAIVPTSADVLKLYEIIGGYIPNDPMTDNGCNESEMCDYMVSTGFLGHQADAVGSVDFRNQDHLRWCTQLFGTCRLGLNLPKFAEQQFENGQPWDINPSGDQTTNGHDVPLVWYGGGIFKCITWAKEQIVTPDFLNLYLEEAHAELVNDWVTTQGVAPSKFDLADLSSKLQSLT